MVSYVAIVILAACVGGYLSASHGGNAPPYGIPKFVKNVAWAFPAAILCGNIGGVVGYVCGLVNMLKASGHGAGIDLGSNTKEPGKGRFLEKVEYLIYPWLFNRVPRYIYDVVFLSLTGLMAVLGSTVVYLSVCWPAGIVQAFGGIMKGPSYQIGWGLFPDPADDRNTRTGEILTGVFAYAGLAAGYLMVINT